MDWKYILSLTPEDLNEEEKDDLYNTVAWFNSDGEEVSSKKIRALFKVSQEVLKFKGEQVETLIHELDELATKQGEEEARRIESDNEITKSSRSRKSSSIEYENMEQKFIELKSKYKKQIKLNEKNASEMEKLNKKVKNLEQENRQLQNEIQNKSHDGSESDISETVRDQHKELVETVQNKNKQISDLLHDIEEVEQENSILREKIANVKDELSNATQELTAMTERINASEIKLEENLELYQKLIAKNDDLQDELKEAQDKNKYFEDQMEEFTTEINLRIDNWKELLDQKDAEIQALKSRTIKTSIHSSLSSLPNDDYETPHVNAFSKALNDREKQLLEVQVQLQNATKEMDASTIVLQKLKLDREADNKKIKELEMNLTDVKKQLKATHERCQSLQEEVAYAEKTSSSKDKDLKEIIEKMEGNGQVELSNSVKQVQDLKGQVRIQEKQIMNLVKASNKLQDSCEQYEKENYALREKLGMSDEEMVSLVGVTAKQRRQKKEVNNMKKELNRVLEENLGLKGDAQKLNRTIASLSNQILELGHKPVTESNGKNENKYLDGRWFKEELKWLVEENEALRKGMHEILNSINTKKETTLTEIKSETFEKLLRALDVKHISGWYHPAMRLQAELHNLEGINAELREQLRLVKVDLHEQKYTPRSENFQEIDKKIVMDLEYDKKEPEHKMTEESKLMDEESNTDNINKNLQIIINKINSNFSEENLVQIKRDMVLLQKQIDCLFREQSYEKQIWEENLQRKSCGIQELEEKIEIFQEKLKFFTENQTEDSLVTKLEEKVTESILLQRKVKYLKTEVDRINADTEMLKKGFKISEIEYKNNINDLTRKNQSLRNNLAILESCNEMAVDPQIFQELQKNLDNLTIKNRQLLENFKESNEESLQEIKMLQENEKLLEQEKVEIKTRLVEVLKKLHSDNLGQNVEENVEKLSKKLAECEISEISERQRANHTNNLYQLVKDQLQKSEERFKEFSKFNEEVLHKNLLLQEQLKEAEGKLCDCVDRNLHRQLQTVYNNLLKEKEQLQSRLHEISEKLRKSKEVVENQYFWTSSKEQELLSLKHQIVDLIADSDDKMQIALLHSDLSNCRKLEIEQRQKLELLSKEFGIYKEENENAVVNFEQEKAIFQEKESEINRKNRIMQDLLLKQKMQYLGCIPLCSEEKFVIKLNKINKEKHQTFLHLHKAKIFESEIEALKDQCEIELQNLIQQKQIMAGGKDEFKNVLNWVQEKKILQLNELRFRRQSEFKEIQLNHLIQRVQTQDDQIGKLEEELLLCHKNFDFTTNSYVEQSPTNVAEEILPSKPLSPRIKLTKSEEIQTMEIVGNVTDVTENQFAGMKLELITVRNDLADKEQITEQLRSKVIELEMTISMFKKQIGDKQSQITFYERHILELQTKKEEINAPSAGPDGDNINVGPDNSNEDNLTLKATIATMQEKLAAKEEKILEYQSLLKEDRDKHSLAAERLQDELKNLQKSLTEEKQKFSELEEYFNHSKPNMATIDQYISQVHALEKHTAELHTNVTSLDAQLQSSRQEAARWRVLANDRLEAMEELRDNLEEQHKSELSVYKNDSNKWREEVNNLKELISVHRSQSGHFGDDIKNLIKDRDYKITELTQLLRQTKNDARKSQVDKSDSDLSPKLNELESAQESLLKENETIKKRYDQLLNRERTAREEIRELRSQLMKKQTISIRGDKTEKSIKEQLQKKVALLEGEIGELKEKLMEQIAINDTHRIKISEDFDRWKKQKYWQQSIEKLKNKLKERDVDLEKLQQTCSGYRLLIERLEREKNNLENRVKSLKKNNVNFDSHNELEMLRIENHKLMSEIEVVNSKLEMHQHHAGGLGTTLLQEKLESQERKIAVLELTSKGPAEVRAELERLQSAISTLQKSNLCLEAENLDLKLDLEKSNKELPYLREQIQHLENYIEVLKKEHSKQPDNLDAASANPEPKKVSELERTVFILKRVVEKLQVENKRLSSGKSPYSDRSASADKLKRDYVRLKEQHTEGIKKVAQLEQDLAKVNNKNKIKSKRSDEGDASVFEENVKLKEQLEHKGQLLDKVKVLLHRAAAKEKSLLQEIAEMKHQEAPQSDGSSEL